MNSIEMLNTGSFLIFFFSYFLPESIDQFFHQKNDTTNRASYLYFLHRLQKAHIVMKHQEAILLPTSSALFV